MIHNYQLPNYWTWQVFLCVNDGNESLKEIAQYYNKKFDAGIGENLTGESPCCLYSTDNLIAIICINDWDFDAYHVGIISHEILHMLICISYACECPINMHTSECWAYTMNSFMDTFLDVLNKNHLKKDSKNVRSDIQPRSRKRHSTR